MKTEYADLQHILVQKQQLYASLEVIAAVASI